MTLPWKRWPKRRSYAVITVVLLTILPVVAYRCAGYNLATVVIYWLTALVVLAYTYETYGMRQQMIRQNEIAIQPLLIMAIDPPTFVEQVRRSAPDQPPKSEYLQYLLS
jgi:hypothetical protein